MASPSAMINKLLKGLEHKGDKCLLDKKQGYSNKYQRTYTIYIVSELVEGEEGTLKKKHAFDSTKQIEVVKYLANRIKGDDS